MVAPLHEEGTPANQRPQTAAECGSGAPEVPGGVYLCQVNEKVSCGACCGLYNVPDLSRERLGAMLAQRTDAFRNTPRTVAAIDDFAGRRQAIEPQERPFPQFHHCPYIGLIGSERKRVGCLLHPLAEGNDGIDYRGLSYYGGLACRTYFCPATHRLPARHKEILRRVLSDWFAFGLIVTEEMLLKALFGRLENALARTLTPELLKGRPEAAGHLAALLQLKIDWPYRPPRADTPCHHFFFDVGYAKPAIAYEAMGVPPSAYDDILVELVSEFQRPEDLAQAEKRIASALERVVVALA